MAQRWKPAKKYSKCELLQLVESARSGDPESVDEAVTFFVAETRGLWHGRARAKICRVLKSQTIDSALERKLVAAVCDRLERGDFSEQFRDNAGVRRTRFRVEERLRSTIRTMDVASSGRRFVASVVDFGVGHCGECCIPSSSVLAEAPKVVYERTTVSAVDEVRSFLISHQADSAEPFFD